MRRPPRRDVAEETRSDAGSASFLSGFFLSLEEKEKGADERKCLSTEERRRRVERDASNGKRVRARQGAGGGSFPCRAKGGLRESNPRPPRPKRGIMPLDQVPSVFCQNFL